MSITAPRDFKLLPNDGLLESITQWVSGEPLPVNTCAPTVVDTLPPTWMVMGSPVGAL